MLGRRLLYWLPVILVPTLTGLSFSLYLGQRDDGDWQSGPLLAGMLVSVLAFLGLAGWELHRLRRREPARPAPRLRLVESPILWLPPLILLALLMVFLFRV